jgi:hypothetical protein
MDHSDVSTVELPVSEPEPARRPHLGGPWRELSGALAVGMSVLAVVVVVFQVLAWARDMPGPGVWTVLGHLGAAVLAVVAQRFVDRRAGWVAALSVLGVVAVTGATLWLFWWA